MNLFVNIELVSRRLAHFVTYSFGSHVKKISEEIIQIHRNNRFSSGHR